MKNKKNYLIEEDFLGEGIKAIFSKKVSLVHLIF